MNVGYFSLNTAEGISPSALAAELEQRGFDSLWLPEHSHIPVVREPGPFGDYLPDGYLHLMDPFVSLASAAMTTTTLTLGTGISMILEHDLLDLACRLATLDVLSGGRIRFGVGAGWIPEELHNHRPDVAYTSRYAAVAERVRALRTIWSDEEPEFAGRWDRFDRSWVNPKPVQQRLPIGFGMNGDLGTRYAAELADEWYPIDFQLDDVAARIATFRSLVEQAGRQPDSVSISLFVWGWEPGNPSIDLLKGYRDVGIERVVVCPPSMARHDVDSTLRRLDEFDELLT